MPIMNPIRITGPAALALALILLSAGCARVPVIGEAPQAKAQRAEVLMQRGDHAAAAQLYAEAARTARGDERNRLRLAAGEAAARAGDRETAAAMLDAVDVEKLTDSERARLRLARTELRIVRMQPEQALRLLPPPESGAPPEVAARTWLLRAQLLRGQGRLVESVHALTQRGIWLPEPERARANDQRIWSLLENYPAESLTPEALASTDGTTRGWLALARIDSRTWSGRGALEDALIDWERRYPGHPAARTILPEKFDYSPIVPGEGLAVRDGRDLGLALPLTGRFAEAAAAVRNGFLAAYYASETPRPRLRLYDTNAVPNMSVLLEQARADGVGLLVGPLDKSHVAELRQMPQLDIPVLALNYIDSDDGFPGFYQFGLAPEDEAEAAAERAVRMRLYRGLALVPDNEWGERILIAFRDSLYYAGGELIDYVLYNPYRQDFSDPIKKLLQYTGVVEEDEEEAPEDEAGPIPAEEETADASSLEEPIEEGRRQDADFVFIAAQPAQARLIRSQLRFYRAMQLPVFSTSHVYTGQVDPGRDGDLNGLMFPDMPWVLARGEDVEARRARLQRLWPDASSRYPRLFAMGQDAWRLQAHLRNGDARSGFLFSGDTGELYLYPSGEIHRTLDWAHFVNGRPKPLAPPIPVSIFDDVELDVGL